MPLTVEPSTPAKAPAGRAVQCKEVFNMIDAEYDLANSNNIAIAVTPGPWTLPAARTQVW
jgi:hypothetical protein